MSIPLFRLLLAEKRLINVPFVGQAQPAADWGTSRVGVWAGVTGVGGGAAGRFGVTTGVAAVGLEVTGGGMGIGVATGLPGAGAEATGVAEPVAGRRMMRLEPVALPPLPKRITWPTWMT